MTPATPAPADGAPGERVSVSATLYDTLLAAADSWAESHGGQYDGEAHATRLMFAAHRLRESAAPLPAPSASAGVGAETLAEWRELATDLIDEGWPADDLAHQVAAALRAACDALSTAAAPPRALTDAEAQALVREYDDAADATELTVTASDVDPDGYLSPRALLEAQLAESRRRTAAYWDARVRLIAALTGGAS